MAVNRVAELLRKVTMALDGADIPYAVVGGNAVAAWVGSVDEDAVRATKDVDILLRRADIVAVTTALRQVGLEAAEVLGVHMFVDRQRPSPKSGVHVVLANERIRPEYQHAAPDVASAVRAQDGYRVIDLPSLLAMKLQSFRDVDRTHIRDMNTVGLLTTDVMESLPLDLRERLDQILSNP